MHLGQKSKVQGPLAGLLQAYPTVRLLQPERARLLRYPCSGCGRTSMMALTTAKAYGPMLLPQALILPPEHFAAYWRAKGMCAGSAFCLCGTRLLGYEGTRTFSWKISFMLLVNLTFTVLCARVNGTVK